jgi:signal transduction histidine kinase
VRELSGLTRSLLQLSRSEYMHADCTGYDVATIVESLDAADNPRVSVDIRARPTACLHPELFTIAISNLVSNALKYSDPETGKVVITVDKKSVSVSDNGIGIPAKDLPHVWDRFYKVDDARTYASGHGLGLSIVRVIIEEVHGMRIGMQSEPGKGTTVTVEW